MEDEVNWTGVLEPSKVWSVLLPSKSKLSKCADGGGFNTRLLLCIFPENVGWLDTHECLWVCILKTRDSKLPFDLWCMNSCIVTRMLCVCVCLCCRAALGRWYLWIWTPTTGTDRPFAPYCPESPALMWVLPSISDWRWPKHGHQHACVSNRVLMNQFTNKKKHIENISLKSTGCWIHSSYPTHSYHVFGLQPGLLVVWI